MMKCLAKNGQEASPPPALLKLRSATWFISATICVAVFTDIFLYGMIVPVIPFALSQRAGVEAENVQHWVSILLAAYGGALLAASPLCGWLADKSPNRRVPLLVGLVALGAATVLLCLGSNVGTLLAGRLFQGFSEAVVWTVGLALMVDTVGQKNIGQAMGYVYVCMNIGTLIAPLLGGIVYQAVGYYSVFYMAFGLIVLDIFLRLALVEKKVAQKWIKEPSVEPPLPSALIPLTPPDISITVLPPSSRLENNDQVFVPEEQRTYSSDQRSSFPPIITLLGFPRLLAALWGCMVQATLLTAFDTVLPLRVRDIFGWSSTGAGLIFLALVVPSFIAPVAGSISDKYGAKWIATVGFILCCPSLVLMRLVNQDSLDQKVLLCALLALIGTSLSLIMTPLVAEVTYVVEEEEKKSPGAYGKMGAYAQAYGLFNTAFASGTLVGPIWGGFVVAKAGWATMVWSLGLLSALSVVPTVIWTGGLIMERRGEHARWNDNAAVNNLGTA